MVRYDPLLDLKDAPFSDDLDRPMLHEIATAVGHHLHRFADAGAWLDAEYDVATVNQRHLRESMDWQLLEEARRTPLTTPSDANADHETRKERRTFRRDRVCSLRDIKARWSNNRGRFFTAWLDVIHDLAERPLDERTEDDASTLAHRLLLIAWLITDPDADSREPVVTELQHWPWEALSDDDAEVCTRRAVRRELFGGPGQSGPKPRPVQGLGVLREGWKWAMANLPTFSQDVEPADCDEQPLNVGVEQASAPKNESEVNTWPYEYGSDLHWLWGWAERIDRWLVDGVLPNRHLPGVFCPDPMADKAMTWLSDRQPQAFGLIQSDLANVQKQFDEKDGSESQQDELCHAMVRLRDRILETARLVNEAGKPDRLPKGKTAQLSTEEEGGPESEQPPALTKGEQVTLDALATFDASRLAFARDVSDAMPREVRLSERTTRPAIKKLVKLGLAERPEGEKQGARLTMRGRRLATIIAD